MKNFLLSIFMTTTLSLFSQTEFYSTNGKNRLTKSELDVFISNQNKKLSETLKKDMIIEVSSTKTKKKNDSIIHFVTLGAKGVNLISNNFSNFLNKPFPEFTLKNLKGKVITLDDLIGKPTMINFWFTRCAPCINEMPALNKIQEEYKADYNFIAITYESPQDVRNFLKKRNFNFNHIIDAKEFIDKLKINSYPLNFFLDKNGIVKDVKYGIPKIKNKEGELKMGDGKNFVKILQSLE